MFNSVILDQSLNYSAQKLKAYLRSNKLKFSLFLIFFTIYSFALGAIILVLFLAGHPEATFRTIFSNAILAFYLTIFVYSLVSSASGVSNPFLSNRADANFQLLIPINPFVSFFSVKINNALRDLIFTIIACVLLFVPLMIILNKNTVAFRMILVTFGFFLGIEIISLFGSFIYLILQGFRKGKSWSVTFAENNDYFVIVLVAIPAVFFYLMLYDMLPSYETLLNFSFLPIINIATDNIGFFFRSGIPFYSYLSIIYSLIQLLILLVVNLLLIKYFYSSAELGEILPVMKYFEDQRDMFRASFHNLPSPSIDKVNENVIFYSKNDLYTLMRKDWVLIKRTTEIKSNYIVVWILIMITVVIDLLKIHLSAFVTTFIEPYFGVGIGMELGCLVTIYQSIKLNDSILPINKRNNAIIKTIYSFIFLVPFLILFVIKLNPLAIIFILALLLISEILNRININSYMVNFIIGMGLFPFFTFIFLP